MERNRHWLAWIAIGIGGLALLVALFGGSFASQIAAAGQASSNAPQPYAQQGGRQRGGGAQNMPAGPGGNVQQAPGQQNVPAGPGGNVQQAPGQPGGRAGRGSDMRPGPGRPGDGGFGSGGWLGLPFRLIGGLFRIGMLALLVVLGLWLFRRRPAVASASSARAEPAQSQPPQPDVSPTDEAYVEDDSE